MVDAQAIANFEKFNPEVLESMVYVHENFHWLQLTSSTMGHIVSELSHLHQKSVQFGIEAPELRGHIRKVKNPLLKQVSDFTDAELRILKNDLTSIELFQDLMVESNLLSEISDRMGEYNQALFSIYDMYLMQAKECLEEGLGETGYQELVKKNRDFWGRPDVNKLYALDPQWPLIGYRDLVECAARVVEIKYYFDMKEKFRFLSEDKSIDESFLYDPDYFRPMEYIQKVFGISGVSEVIEDFLLLSIHIAINPPVPPFFDLALSHEFHLSDIHPGMRFVQILAYIKRKYETIERAMRDVDLYGTICVELNWPSDNEFEPSLRKYYSPVLDRIGALDNGVDFIHNSKIHAPDYFVYRYSKTVSLKARYSEYFRNPVPFMSNPDQIEATSEIETSVHCPVWYNVTLDKYQANLSGLIISGIDSEGRLSELVNLKKSKTDSLAQEYLNYVMAGFFNAMDRQLLYDTGDLDFSIIERFDLDDGSKKFMVQHYKDSRRL
jgi:hypothetical protein